jgi:catechol 2,3-dioxygenase-like lactoylglutathione lyase family enzyme
MIYGAHVIIESSDADADRVFMRDVLGFDSVDAGGGWLIFALPPAELALHPGTNGRHQLYLMCDNLDSTLAELHAKGVSTVGEISEERWGRIASIRLPGSGALSIYEPRHPSPLTSRS